jgi:beta-glucosidase
MRRLDINPADFDFAGGIENTFIIDERPGMRALEEYELMQHYSQWRGDLERAASLGIKKLRWGVPWYRVEPRPGEFDWSWIDEVLDYMVNHLHIEPIIDLMHYGTPSWLEKSFADRQYPQRVASYAAEFTKRYHHLVRYYTPLNEPTVNSDFCCRTAQWPPYLTGDKGFVAVMLSIAKGIQLTSRAIRAIDKDAVLVAVEAMRLFRVVNPKAAHEAHLAFLKDMLCWDLVSGLVDKNHGLYDWVKQNGATEEQLAELIDGAVHQDILGVNFYPWSIMDATADDGGKVWIVKGPNDGRYLADMLRQVYAYASTPLFVTETSAPGMFAERQLWMAETLDAVRIVRAEGIPVIGYTWFPLFTMVDWGYRTSGKPISDHLFHLGLWDATFDEAGVLVRRETPLVASYRDWVKRGMALPLQRKSSLFGCINWWRTRFGNKLRSWRSRFAQ